MTKGAMAALSAGVAVFGFDPDPGPPASRALHVLTVKRTLPTGDLGAKERFPEAALRAATEGGIDLGGRRGARGAQRLHLVGVDDDPARTRSVTVWYYAAAPYGPDPGPGVWSPTGRGLHLDAQGAAALRAALDRLRSDTRQLAGAAALPSLRRLIDNQREFIGAFEEIIRRPNGQEEVLRDMAVRCLAA